jgi:lipopolysaccharide transport system ATP-binding protein
MNDVAIMLQNVSKSYKLYAASKDRLKEAFNPFGKKYHKELYILKDINLEVKKGEILGVVGKNGSGKSTLLKLIAGVLKPNTGAIFIDGKISALLELGGGFNPEFTGKQNILFMATIQGISKKNIEYLQKRIIDFADIGEYIDQPLKTYSSGMKSRLGFAIAVHIDPDILILDEVFAVGDILFKRKCYAKMEEYFKGGKTIIYVSHSANSIIELCTRAIFLDSSKILLDSVPKTVISYYQKYIFAQNKYKQIIRDEINNLAANDNNNNQIHIINNNDLLRLDDTKEQDGYFIPELKPKSTIEYKYYKVDIDEVFIKTVNNNKANILKNGKIYFFCAKIHFGIDASNIGFTFSIKNEKGMDISSYKTLKNNFINAITGDVYEVKWRFINRLLPGIYYLNIGIRCYPDNREPYVLNRIIDVMVFKIESDGQSMFGGIVSLDQKLSIMKCNE